MSQEIKTPKTENYFSGNDNIMENINDALILLNHDLSREDVKSIYNIAKQYGVRYRDVQIKDRRNLVKVVLESKLREFKKIKTIIKNEKKRKREDKDDEQQMAKVKEIGKAVKKETRGGKLKQPLKAIQNAEPTKSKYIVVAVEFYGDSNKLFTISPFNKDDIIKQIKDLTRSREIQGEVRFSDAVGDVFVPGKRIKSFKLTDRNSFEQWNHRRLR